ncbi:hypothetical protein DsansV1_C35g0230881 [Dioscorea sansibarensis]
MVGRFEGNVAVHMIPSLKTISISCIYAGSLMSSSKASNNCLPPERCRAQSASEPSSPPSWAFLPVVSSSSTTPKLYTSTFSFTFLDLLACIASSPGAMYPKVPATADTISGSPVFTNVLASPKSAIFAPNSVSRRMLLDFTSLCTTGGLQP